MTITLDEALKAIQEFIDTKQGQDLNSLVIVASTSMISPSVRAFNCYTEYKTFNTTNLGKLYTVPVVNPSWIPKKYELQLFTLPVVEPEPKTSDSKVPEFCDKFNVGDRFKISNPSHRYFNKFFAPVKSGDILVINQVDRADSTQPYRCFLERDPDNVSWGSLNQFQDLIESGGAVLIPKVTLEQSVLPFHKRYKVGDKFRVVNTNSDYLREFDTTLDVGDTLTIKSTDIYYPECPYKVYADKGAWNDYVWGEDNQFEQCVAAGDVVFIDPTAAQYESVTLGGVTYNLVPQ